MSKKKTDLPEEQILDEKIVDLDEEEVEKIPEDVVVSDEEDVLSEENDTPVEPLVEIKRRYKKLVQSYNGNIEAAIFQTCYENNIFYDEELLHKKFLKTKDDEILMKMPEVYIWEIQSDPKYEGLTFFSQLKRENFEKIYSEDLSLLTLNEDDKKNRQQIINILGYDPFKNDPAEDRPQLYRDLAGMLTDAMRKDVPKQKAAVEIVRNYANITRYQTRVTEIMKSGQLDAATQEELDNLISFIEKLQRSVNQTTKENGFTGGKTLGSGGRGMLSDVMMQCEDLGYDPGITNFYDISTSKSIGEIANISWKAMFAQLGLSDTDYADILAEQAKLVIKAQRTASDALEALRLAKEKITKEGLIAELESDYRRKGISEEEIAEFVGREFKLYQGKEQ